MGQRVLAADVHTRMGWVAFLMRDFDKSLDLLKNGHCLHQESDYIRGVAMALSHMGKVHTVLGDYVQARLYLQEALISDANSNTQEILLGRSTMWATCILNTANWLKHGAIITSRWRSAADSGHTPQLLQSMNNLALLHVA